MATLARDDDLAARYAERGYAVLPAAVAPALCRTILGAIERIQMLARDAPPAVARFLLFERELPDAKRNGVPAAATGDALFIVNDPCRLDPAFAAILTDDAVTAPVRRLLGTDDIRLHFCNVTMKRRRVGSGISWHRGVPNGYLSPPSLSCLRAMLCLDGMDDANGGTVFLAGSHIAPADGPPTRAAFEAAPVKRVRCPPGSLVFIHPQVLHGGPPNASARHRRNFVMQWGRGDDPVRGPGPPELLTNLGPEEIRDWARRAAPRNDAMSETVPAAS